MRQEIKNAIERALRESIEHMRAYDKRVFDSDIKRVPATREGYLGIRRCDLLDTIRLAEEALYAVHKERGEW